MNNCLDCNKLLKEARANRCKSCSKKGILHPLYKNGKPKCIDCGEKLKDYRSKRCWVHASKARMTNKLKKFLSKKFKGIRRSKNTEFKKGHKKSPTLSGELSPFYIHGQGNFPYPLCFSKRLKTEIRKRDNYKCQNCRITEKEHLKKYKRVLDVHHIDYNKENCKKKNLITLCSKCNIKANTGIDYWYAYYTYLKENK